MQKPSIPKGTRDFNPIESARRNYIFSTIRTVFQRYGYAQIETPAMENLSTLLGKYGQEGDKLLFKVLNSGDCFAPLAGQFTNNSNEVNSNALSLKVCEKGLRYDLTVPFARFVVQHQNELTFPFKRYQLQPVWRADRPQKGRYREFYQCDVDVIGSDSLLNELELMQIVDDVFSQLGIGVEIKVNNRKVLTGIAEIMGCQDKVVDITVAIDKLDKVGFQAVEQELIDKGLSSNAIHVLTPLLSLQGSSLDKFAYMRVLFSGSETQIRSEVGLKGLEELSHLFDLVNEVGLSQMVEFDLSLARGLNYYTGAIFEVKARDYEMGSICGGGRYDNLTGIFGVPNLSGVGISFGADRIYDVLLGLEKFPESVMDAPRVVFFNLGDVESARALSCAKVLRLAGVSAEVFPDNVKMKKQFDYATRRGILYAAIIGENEVADHTVTLKNLVTGVQETISDSTLLEKVKN